MDNYNDLTNFLNKARLRFQTQQSEIAKRICLTLKAELNRRRDKVPEAAPVCISLADFLPKKQTDLSISLARCANVLNWREAGFGKLPKELSKRIYASELIGPKGLFESSSIRIGLLIQQEQLAYPKHRHAAEELYLVLNGHAYWSIDDDPAIIYPPDTKVHHKSRQPHSMTTGAEPLLAMWGWTGDIKGDSYSI